MKKSIISIVLILTAMFSIAQVNTESSTHLAFKGVPIDGTLREYTLKMENIGFSQIEAKDEITLLKGDFAPRWRGYVTPAGADILSVP